MIGNFFPREKRSAVPLFLYLFAIATVSCAIVPIRALFLIEVLGGNTFENGLSFALPALISIAVGPAIGNMSDSLHDRRPLISVSLLAIGALSVFTSFTTTASLFLLITILSGPVGAISYGQFFAWARERELAKFGEKAVESGELRIGLIVGWATGPAITGGLLILGLSFREMYVAQGMSYMFLAAMIWLFRGVDSAKTLPKKTDKFRWSDSRLVPPNLLWISLFVAFVLSGDMVRVANLSLFVREHISNNPIDLTLAFAATPIVEIPVAAICVVVAKRLSSKFVLGFGVFAGALYFVLSPFPANITQVILLQALYAIVPASAIGVGISYAQSCAPDRLGFATSFVFAGQSLAVVLGGVMAAVGGLLLSVQTTYYLPLFFSFMAMFAWTRLDRKQ